MSSCLACDLSVRLIDQLTCKYMYYYIYIYIYIIGATLNKGFNRALGTLSAGALALAIAELSMLAGQFQEVIIVISIFIAGTTTLLHLNNYIFYFYNFLSVFCISQFLSIAIIGISSVHCLIFGF